MKTKLNALSAWLDRHALPLGAALAAALSLLLALYNVGGGPLGNLNDIGGWRNRALYIALTAAVQLFVLLAAALLYHERFWRLAVRQLLLTVGLVILLMGINHGTGRSESHIPRRPARRPPAQKEDACREGRRPQTGERGKAADRAPGV